MWEPLDVGFRPFPEIFDIDRDLVDPSGQMRILDAYVDLSIPEENRAWAFELRPIHYDRIYAVDDIGDVYNKPPHLLVDYYTDDDPFDPKEFWFLEDRKQFGSKYSRLDNMKRVDYFPDEIPDRREEWQEELQKRIDQTRT
jgi:hypothetical protein